MGNASSHESRRCGLCLFQLGQDAAVLEEPQVRRQASTPRTQLDPTVDPLDTIPEMPPNTGSIEFTTEQRALPASAERGCIGCKAIWAQVKQQAKDRGFVMDDSCTGKELVMHWMIGDRGKDTKGLTVITWVLRDDKPSKEYFRFVFEHSGQDYPHPAAVPLSKVVKEGNTGSPASLNSINTWLEECNAEHATCRPPAAQLPDRVLKFSKNKLGRISVRLVENLNRSEPYAALSHRWGPSTPNYRTMHDTLAANLESIAWTKLPKTFQEAIEVSIHLGLKYLWIDSLCIIQDSKEDWLVQSAKMCDIYQGAHITIAATNSDDSVDGLFRDVPKTPLDAEARRRDAKMYIRDRPVTGGELGVEGHEAETPLLTRGWVFQERLLSRRVVHFAPREVVFECVRSGNRCDCGHEGNWAVRQAHFETLRNYMELIGLDQVQNHWQTLVRLFCMLDLTFYSDMLPALAGIARQLGTARGADLGRYLAGLWEVTLVSDLVWVVRDGHLRETLPQGSLLPSWSWASRAGAYTWIRYKKTRDELELSSFKVDLVGKDEYGPVNSAELTMRGYLARGSWEVAAELGPSGGPRVDFYAFDGSSRRCHIDVDYNFIDPDSESYINPDSSLYAMKTGVMSKAHLCLVLQAVDREDGTRVYKRVGLLDETPVSDVDSWYPEGSEPETIVFV